MRSLIIAVALIVVGCDVPPSPCHETACKPDWSGDCTCMTGQYMEHQSDGTIICRCKGDAGQ